MSDQSRVPDARPVTETKAALARVRARHAMVDMGCSWSDVETLRSAAAGLDADTRDWLEEIAIRVGRELERDETRDPR